MGKNRVEWIDLVRAIAILTVLYIHATDGIYIISSDAILNYTVFSRIFNFASLFIGRIGVPFFLMITGYLLLDRSYDDERVRKFWQKNCWACYFWRSGNSLLQSHVVYANDYWNVSFNSFCF